MSSSRWMSPFAMGVQSGDEYSKNGLTKLLLRVSMGIRSLVVNVLNTHEDILFADAMMVLTWSLKVVSADNSTPRSRTVFFSINSDSGDTYDVEFFRSLFFPKRSDSNLRELNFMLFVSLHP